MSRGCTLAFARFESLRSCVYRVNRGQEAVRVKFLRFQQTYPDKSTNSSNLYETNLSSFSLFLSRAFVHFEQSANRNKRLVAGLSELKTKS